QNRHNALLAAVAEQTIEPVIGDTPYCFARLHAAVVRRLLAMNDRLESLPEPEPKPIERILPTRFEIIVDVNLEHPGGREAARQWVFENIDEAKREAEVRDSGQEIHAEKSRLSNQYLFARLEARAIQ